MAYLLRCWRNKFPSYGDFSRRTSLSAHQFKLSWCLWHAIWLIDFHLTRQAVIHAKSTTVLYLRKNAFSLKRRNMLLCVASQGSVSSDSLAAFNWIGRDAPDIGSEHGGRQRDLLVANDEFYWEMVIWKIFTALSNNPHSQYAEGYTNRQKAKLLGISIGILEFFLRSVLYFYN